MYFKTEMAGEIIRELFPDFFDLREVNVEIKDPSGALKYNATHDTTKQLHTFSSNQRPMVSSSPENGTSTLLELVVESFQNKTISFSVWM